MSFTTHVRSLLILLFAILWSANGVAARANDLSELFAAAEKGDAIKIKQIVAAGIDVNAPDSDGWTALMVAASVGKLPAVQALIMAGANVNAATGKGETPLMAAALSGNAAIVKLLLAEGADKTAASAQGLTAADVAVRTKHPELAKILQLPPSAKIDVAPPAINNTKKIETKVNAAASAFQAGSYAEAAELFREVVSLDPRHALAWHFLGQSLEKTGDSVGAQRAYRKSLEIQPNGANADRTRMLFSKITDASVEWKACNQELLKENSKKALEGCSNIIALGDSQKKRDREIAFGRRATWHGLREEYDDSIADFTSAIELGPETPPWFYWRGEAYFMRGSLDNAIADLTSGIRLSPNSAAFFSRRGRYFEKKKDIQRALDDYRKAMQLDPNDETASQGIQRLRL
jgi:Flp pilus assembly protein TadD